MSSRSHEHHFAYAEAFKDQSVVDAYHLRPPYPPEIFAILAGLMIDEPHAVLDIGCGSGDIARHIVDVAERVDAVDFSQIMIEKGKQLTNGNHPRLHWIFGRVEEVPLNPPYALITAGSSFHWMDWNVLLPRCRAMLTSHGKIAVVSRHILPQPWQTEIEEIRRHFATHHNTRHARRITAELVERGLFQILGQQETAPIAFHQSIDDFIAGLHSRSGLSRERMSASAAAEFDKQIRNLLWPLYGNGLIPFQVVGKVIWGRPVSL
jgi:ubiquinone/menaquinone biosynthesis C-methylase UbiE